MHHNYAINTQNSNSHIITSLNYTVRILMYNAKKNAINMPSAVDLFLECIDKTLIS